MKEASIIFPDQLLAHHPALSKQRTIILMEEFLYFRYYRLHKQKLIFLRSAMHAYQENLRAQGFHVTYIYSSHLKARGSFIDVIHKYKISCLHVMELCDDWLTKDIEKACIDHDIKIYWYPSASFICQVDEIKDFLANKNHYAMSQFYAWQRKKHNILMEKNRPLGGKFSFDSDNRKRLPKDIDIPPIYVPKQSQLIKQTIESINKDFPDSLGEASVIYYPVTHQDAQKALHNFIANRLALFGDYEDAISSKQSYLFHSVLSPLINIGLLTPKQVIDEVLLAHKEFAFNLNSVEGFIRQILGWREFMRAVYLLKGQKIRGSNFFNHHQLLCQGFYEGNTGIDPLDDTLKKVLKTGYCHHIERLMILGNFMMITETHPHIIYQWFMELFIDAYDWVMVPNVYAMSQYADGGHITTKPYISSSNYIIKMSDYKKGSWSELWDGLFWRFINKHKIFFTKNIRTIPLVKILAKNESSIKKKINNANEWLKQQSSKRI